MNDEIVNLRRQTQRVIAALESGADGRAIAGILAEREACVHAVVNAMRRGHLPAQEDLEEVHSLENMALEMLQRSRDLLYAMIEASRRAQCGTRAYEHSTPSLATLQLDGQG